MSVSASVQRHQYQCSASISGGQHQLSSANIFTIPGSFSTFISKQYQSTYLEILLPNRPYQELWFLFQPVRLNESTNAVSTVQRCVSLSVNMERNIQIIRYQYYEDIHIIHCPKVYRPVCASNGAANITFTNECQLQVKTIMTRITKIIAVTLHVILVPILYHYSVGEKCQNAA